MASEDKGHSSYYQTAESREYSSPSIVDFRDSISNNESKEFFESIHARARASIKSYDEIKDRRRLKSTQNISDLILDQTLRLESSGSNYLGKHRKYDFNSTDISGRTTEEILADSFVEEIRAGKHNSSLNVLNEHQFDSSASFTWLNTNTCKKKKKSSGSDSGFIPAEEAFSTAKPFSFDNNIDSSTFKESLMSNSLTTPREENSNFSLGGYFSRRSENPFAKEKSPNGREAIALVDQSDVGLDSVKEGRETYCIPKKKNNKMNTWKSPVRGTLDDNLYKIREYVDNMSSSESTDTFLQKFLYEHCKISDKENTDPRRPSNSETTAKTNLSDTLSDSTDSIMRIINEQSNSVSSAHELPLANSKKVNDIFIKNTPSEKQLPDGRDSPNIKKKDGSFIVEEIKNKGTKKDNVIETLKTSQTIENAPLPSKVLNKSSSSGMQNSKSPTYNHRRVSNSELAAKINVNKQNVSTTQSKHGLASLPLQSNLLPNSSPSKLALRCPSQCSSVSDFDVARHGSLIPIKTSALQISWESTRLRISVEKVIQIKNTSGKRLTLKLSVSGPGFQLKDNLNLLVLQSQECRSISIIFNPTMIGPAEGKLNIALPDSASSNPSVPSPLTIPLFGYGGTARIGLENVMKGPDGSKFISLGAIHQFREGFFQSFMIYNKGPLSGFAVIIMNIEKVDIPLLRDSFKISPIKTIIQPESSVEVKIKFSPRKEYLRKCFKYQEDVKTVATLEVIFGDEPTRLRVRDIISKMTNEERSNFMTSSDFDSVWKGFPNEVNSLSASLKEDKDVALNLVNTFKKAFVKLTITRDNFDETEDPIFYMNDSDDTILFRTIVPNNTEGLGNRKVSAENKIQVDTITVSPNHLEIDLNSSRTATHFSIRNHSRVICKYHTKVIFSHLLKINPENSELKPGELIKVNVDYAELKKGFLPEEKIYITVIINDLNILIPVNFKR